MSGNPLHRARAAAVAGLAVTALLLGGCGRPSAPPAGPVASAAADPAGPVEDFVRQLKPSAPYRDPREDERRHTEDAVALLLAGREHLDRASTLLRDVGYTPRVGTDPETGRDYAMFTTEAGGERAWGVLLVDLSRQPELAVEVPHPNSDLRTEDVGLRLFRAVPGSVLLIAGAHRRAGDTRADAAHNPDGLFQVIAGRFATSNLNQIQLHGFAQRSLPQEDVVVSNGQHRSSAPLRRVATALEDADFVTCRAWSARCGQLEGTTNTQAEEARRLGSVFIHLEMSWTVRRDADRRAELVTALATADLSRN
ncbi:hypothetical protein [Micromonospora auratinigra]|uniref:Uncharacterized protein n=1 Tax=Micromonospora auratinigra TaxID=261654 RepID=A0A1A9A4C4_9ACTN|nr:hypothetical protein [Micromonospora auratinigra]SBT50960.1 hypothetical protein GA0070611_4965 [Micromonospora auratinigra]